MTGAGYVSLSIGVPEPATLSLLLTALLGLWRVFVFREVFCDSGMGQRGCDERQKKPATKRT